MEVKTGVSIIILNEKNEILIGKRKGSHGSGLYSIPGGHVDFGETFESTCDRELLEEIGNDFPEVSERYEKIGFSEDFFNKDGKPIDSFDINGKHYVTLYYMIKVKSDVIIKNMEPDKCESWKWSNIKDLPTNMFCDSYNQIIKLKI